MLQRKCALLCVGILAYSLYFLTGCGGSSPSPSVAVTAAASTVDGTDTTTLTATVTNDQNAAGVTWTMSGAGTLSNETTTSATFTAPAATGSAQSATITATSVADPTATPGTATITVPAALTVTNSATSLNGTVGPYSAQLQGSGGIPPYKNWAVAPGSSLPACLTLSSSGAITFTTNAGAAACAAGSPYNPKFTFSDSGTPTPLTGTTQDFIITIAPATPISFTGTVPATGTYNVAYTGSAAASGGTGALSYSVSGGALPPDLSLNTSTGAITGTLSKAADVGTFNFTIMAADAYGDVNTQGYTVVVAQATQTITFANPGTQTVGTPLTLSATASSGLAVSYTSQTTGVCTVAGTTATFIATGTCTIQATQAGNSGYAAATPVSQTFTVNGEAQTITFANPGAQNVGTPLTLSATASSGLPVSLASTTTGVCTVSGTTATFIAIGSCTIQATQAGNSTYAAATMVSQTFNVNGEAQTITFANPGIQAIGTPLPLVATASSGLTVSFASETTGVCTVAGTTASFSATGTCTIQATQAGNSTYAAATPVSQSFTVSAETQTITFNNPGTQTVGTPLSLSATASSGLTAAFTSATTGVCTVSGTSATFIASGTCTIDANQAGNSTYAAAPQVAQSFSVSPEAQTITFANPGTQAVGTPLPLVATASSGLTVAFTSATTGVCTVSGTTATFIATGTCTIDANQAGNSAYAAAPQVAHSFTVNPGTQTITFNNPGTQNVGTPLTLVASASSGLAVSFNSQTTSVCTVAGTTASFIATGSCTIQATQAGNSAWAAATPVCADLHGQWPSADHHLRQPRTTDGGNAAASGGYGQFQPDGDIHLGYDRRLHGFRHDGHVYRRRNLHHRCQPGRQQHLCCRPAGRRQLHRQRRSADHFLRQPRRPDGGNAAASGGYGQLRTDGQLQLANHRRLHGRRNDGYIHRLRNLHYPGHAGRQQHLRGCNAGFAELLGQRRNPDHHLHHNFRPDRRNTADVGGHGQFRPDGQLQLADHQRLHRVRRQRCVYQLRNLHHPGHAKRQRRLLGRNAGLAELLCQPRNANHHLQQSRNPDGGDAADAFGHEH